MRIVYRNDSAGTIHQARAISLITEDSIRYLAPSGDSIHNNVARDYVPDPYGQIISLLTGDSAIIAQYFTVDTAWNFNKCMLVTWLQNDSMTADSVKPIYQGGKKMISELDQSIWEGSTARADRLCRAVPNPCHNGTIFAFTLGTNRRYQIRIFDIQGRKIREITGSSKASENLVFWDCRNNKGEKVRSGVYLYLISGDPADPALPGKVIVQ
jgi:hypothetical protein